MLSDAQKWAYKLFETLVDSPGLFANVVVSVATLLAALGFVISGEEVEAIVSTIFAISSTLAGIKGRQKTVPVDRVETYRTEDGKLIELDHPHS